MAVFTTRQRYALQMRQEVMRPCDADRHEHAGAKTKPNDASQHTRLFAVKKEEEENVDKKGQKEKYIWNKEGNRTPQSCGV